MKELQLIQSNLVAPKGQYNSFGKYPYRSCEDILEAVKPLLEEHNCTLTISDDILEAGGSLFVKAIATLKNEAGETEIVSAFARHAIEKKGFDDAQITGSTSSYARKYALNGLFGIDDTKDDDVTNKQGKGQSSKPAQQSKPVSNLITAVQRKELFALAATKNYPNEVIAEYLDKKYKIKSSANITNEQLVKITKDISEETIEDRIQEYDLI